MAKADIQVGAVCMDYHGRVAEVQGIEPVCSDGLCGATQRYYGRDIETGEHWSSMSPMKLADSLASFTEGKC